MLGVGRWLLSLCCVLGVAAQSFAEPIDLLETTKEPTIVVPGQSAVRQKQAKMLQEEIATRSGIVLPIQQAIAAGSNGGILLGTLTELKESGYEPGPRASLPPEKPEGYAVKMGSFTRVIGHDDLGVLFGIGHLLRNLEMRPGKISLLITDPVITAPKYPMRAHQLGFRYTANSWDSWTPKQFDQYIRDLAVFGANGIELIPELDSTLKDSPHMKMTMWDMNIEMAKITASYGMEVLLWVPLLEEVDTQAKTDAELARWRAMYESIPVVHHVQVPSGDPGDTPVELLLPFMEQMAAVLRDVHPKAKLWMTNQGLTPEENEHLYKYLHSEKPNWLTGMSYGPWAKESLPSMRERTPAQYPIRRYPDINHNVRCQYAVPNWDPAFAMTLGREAPNPRPKAYKHIHNHFAPLTIGFGTYSDGVHDDVNKVVWTAAGWDPDVDLTQLMTEYARYFMSPDLAIPIGKGLLALEENWNGSVLENESIEEALFDWQRVDLQADARTKASWRYQLALMRAYYDGLVRVRLLHDTRVEQRALMELGRVNEIGPQAAIAAARAAFKESIPPPTVDALQKKILDLGEALNQSIGMQLSVPLHQAKNPERGAVLDYLDRPLNDWNWLKDEFRNILELETPKAQIAQIERIVNWESPGEGSYYDDLGHPSKQPHLVHAKTWVEDPGHVDTAQVEYMREDPEFTDDPAQPRLWTNPDRLSWMNQAQTLYGTPLQMRYENLDPKATYTLRITYSGRFAATVKLTADGTHEIHGPMEPPGELKPVFVEAPTAVVKGAHAASGPMRVPKPVDFDVPQEATADGVLNLRWDLVKGRGCQVAEVWLLRN
jgi:hypothetical protein